MVQTVKEKDLAITKKARAVQKCTKLKSPPPPAAPLPPGHLSLRVPAPSPSLTSMVAAEHSHNYQLASQRARSQTAAAAVGGIGENASYAFMERMEARQRAQMQQNLNPVLPGTSGDNYLSTLEYQQRRAALLQSLSTSSSMNIRRGGLLPISLFGPSVLEAAPVQNSSYLAQLLGRELPQPLSARGVGQGGTSNLERALLLGRGTGQGLLHQGTDHALPPVDGVPANGPRSLTQEELVYLADLERRRRGL